ncbi:MAG TPA: hypothetical protein VLV49_09210 [Terriglobales bacterium]|nr:hypothetical protein [Terriglobales bacterium]
MRLLAITAILSVACFAQQAGSRDLTASWRAPSDTIPSPSSSSCPNLNSTIATPRKSAQSTGNDLQLSITEISPPQITDRGTFTAVVRLKNAGSARFKIPWQPDGEQLAHISQDGKEESYEVADVTFWLKTGNKSQPAVFLQSEGALFANPADRATYLELAPGGWVEIKMKGVVECGLPECAGHIQADDHAILTAWWYQRVLTHRVDGCNEQHSSSSVRELDSIPFPVVVRPAAESEKEP